MRKFIRCRRGAISLMTVIVMVPLIAVLAVGGEAGTWYITKQHAQNAADAGAYAGGLKRACELGAQRGTPCGDAKTVSYRGKQFAAQNAFCNAGDAGYPGATCNTTLTQTVAIDVGTYSAGTWTTAAGGSFVRATITQSQPAYLAAVFNPGTVTIGAQAIAQVSNLASPCVLTLTGSISFQGSPNINAPNCGMASNDPNQDALNFTGGGMTLNLGSLSAAGGCTGSATKCSTALTHMPPVTNPFAALDALGSGTNHTLTQTDLGLSTAGSKCPNPLTAYTAATPCLNNNVSLNTSVTLNGGVYFISGNLQLKGTAHTISGTGLLILLSGTTISTNGNNSLTLTGNASVTSAQLPAILQPYASLFANMAIYDQSSGAITFGGTSNLNFTGTMYLPNAPVTFQGNPTVNACGELIAASIAFNGNATFNNTSCATATKPSSMYVSLVQ